MKNTLCFKKELYVVVVKVRAIVLRKIQHPLNKCKGLAHEMNFELNSMMDNLILEMSIFPSILAEWC